MRWGAMIWESNLYRSNPSLPRGDEKNERHILVWHVRRTRKAGQAQTHRQTQTRQTDTIRTDRHNQNRQTQTGRTGRRNRIRQTPTEVRQDVNTRSRQTSKDTDKTTTKQQRSQFAVVEDESMKQLIVDNLATTFDTNKTCPQQISMTRP
jgi:hypothetical protein